MTTNKTMGITTLKKLNKELLKIDLTKVRYKKWGRTFSNQFDPNQTLPLGSFNLNMKDENPHLKFCDGIGAIGNFLEHSTGNWDYLKPVRHHIV